MLILGQMTTPNMQARRATIEDLPKLMSLWQQESLPAEEMGKRLQEFQVIEGAGGEILGALGFQIAGQEARLHSEAFLRPEEADVARAKLWERVQMVSKNHGLARLWTQQDAPFWSQIGFQSSPTELAAKLPAPFAGQPQPWAHIQLRAEAAGVPSIDQEFAIFKEMQRAETQRVFRQAKVMKIVAAVVVVIVCALVVVWIFSWIKAQGMRSR